MPSITIRQATLHDAETIAHHRVAMFRDMGNIPTDTLATQLFNASLPVIAAALDDGTYLGWLAVTIANEVIAGAGVHLKPQFPRASSDGTRVFTSPAPLIVNVYTEPNWRRQGIAKALMQAIMQWATEQHYDRVLLHASRDGRPLYESLGFVQNNEMRWNPPEDR